MPSNVNRPAGALRIGWAQADITPSKPVFLCGQFCCRLSEGVDDPLTATAMAIDDGADHVVFVSCDLVMIPNRFRDDVRQAIGDKAPGLDVRKVVLNATHTHTAPSILDDHIFWDDFDQTGRMLGLEAMGIREYCRFAVDRIAAAVAEAWNGRGDAQIAFGMGYAVVGHNRRWVNVNGVSQMYGNLDTPLMSHIEGYEDHSVGIVAARDAAGRMTGLIVNIACPSQSRESQWVVTADFWHVVRVELRSRLGKDLFVLPQCSAAGDQAPRQLYDKKARNRMIELSGRTECQELGMRIVNGVMSALEVLGDHVDGAAPLSHSIETMDLPLNLISAEEVADSLNQAKEHRATYEQEMAKLEADPSLKNQPRWYYHVTHHRNRMIWFEALAKRRDWQQANKDKGYHCELHVVRLGEIAFATNPFEYYLDYGIRIKVRSPATQTFLVQLAGESTYVPSERSVAGGGYGSMAASCDVGPEGGKILADKTLEHIAALWR
ncbi:MAG: hypothetical protein GXY38_02845 [Planctomycetes bacterium]|jgi:hypothetical protein|nr:hypothetical protein [Planctomycetota bacterium]